jgi:hypothetical protein
MDMFGGFVRSGRPGRDGVDPLWRPLAASRVAAPDVMSLGASRRPASFGPLERTLPFDLWRAFDPHG